jgi:hypothetical protein
VLKSRLFELALKHDFNSGCNQNWREMIHMRQVECWCSFELIIPSLEVLEGGAPPKAIFSKGSRVKEAASFPDSNGAHRIRFMPDEEGEWSYELVHPALGSDEQRESNRSFQCMPPRPGNHGPVRIVSESDFAYADGTPFHPFGTTSLKWHRGKQFESTLEALAQGPFNKIRFTVDAGDLSEVEMLDGAVGRLLELGVEADLLLNCGAGETDSISFLPTLISRLAAYRNVWWSLLFQEERAVPVRNKEAVFQLIQEYDASGHLLTVHTSDVSNNWGSSPCAITHVSLQGGDASQMAYYTGLHRKPVIMDESGCEGNAPTLWGSLPPEEMVNRIWTSVCRRGYAGHGEMLLHTNGESWRTDGGALAGEAAARIAFLRGILEEAPPGLRYMPEFYDVQTIGIDGEYYLQYHGIHRFPSKLLNVPEGRYTVECMDVWNMTSVLLPGEYGSEILVALPSRLYQALRIRSVESQKNPLPGKYNLAGGSLSSYSGNVSTRGKNVQDAVSKAEENENFISQKEKAKAELKGTE